MANDSKAEGTDENTEKPTSTNLTTQSVDVSVNSIEVKTSCDNQTSKDVDDESSTKVVQITKNSTNTSPSAVGETYFFS
jgi:hypothetical protein